MHGPRLLLIVLAALAVPGNAQDILTSYRQSLDGTPFPRLAIDGDRAAVYRSTFRLADDHWEAATDLLGTTHAVGADGGLFVTSNMNFQGGSGVARIQRPTATGWSVEQVLFPSNPQPHLWFGAGVAISGDVAVISARGVVQYNPTVLGAAYVFRSTAAGWIEEQMFTPPTGEDFWNARAAVDGDTLALVGFFTGPGGSQPAKRINVYQRSGGAWSQVAVFPFPDSLSVNPDVAVQEDDPGVAATIVVNGSATETRAYEGYGSSWTATSFPDGYDGGVALDGDVLALGSREADAPGVPAAGSVDLFLRDAAGSWTYQRTLRANDPRPNGQFGLSLTLEGEWLAVGGGTSTVDMFRILELGAGEFCVGSPNSTGEIARITRSGSTSIAANDLELVAGPVPSTRGLFLYGSGQLQLPFGDGFRCVGAGRIYRLPFEVGNGGLLTHRVDLTAPPSPAGQVLPGSTHLFQAWYRDPSGSGSGFNTSTGLELSFLP